MRVWVDASILIALDSLGALEFLHRYLGTVFTTPAVRKEVIGPKASGGMTRAFGDWIRVRGTKGDPAPFRRLGLSAGEASLLLTPSSDLLVLDELGARRAAASEGRRVTGLLGLLIAAKRDGVLSLAEALRMLDALAVSRFYLSGELAERVRRELRQ